MKKKKEVSFCTNPECESFQQLLIDVIGLCWSWGCLHRGVGGWICNKQEAEKCTKTHMQMAWNK